MEKLRQLMLAYERDEKHAITKEHIAERQRCVIAYGSEAVQQLVREVCQEIINERRLQPCYFAENAKKPLSHVQAAPRKSTSAHARSAKPKKTSSSRLKAYRKSAPRR